MILIAEDMHPALMTGLDESKIPFHYRPEISLTELMEIIPNYEGLVLRSKFFADKPLLDAGKQLKFIGRAGSGMDNIDEAYALSKEITLLNAPEGLCDAVAEHAIGMILALQHKILASDREVKNRSWQRMANRGTELKSLTVGIIGYGHTGSALARKLSGFGVTVIAYDKYKKNFSDTYATSCNLQAIYEQTDILSLHIPLTEETTGWINEKFFEEFKKPLILVNTARGKIVNTRDLVLGLQQKKIIAAGLDVLEQEPPFAPQPDEDPEWFSMLSKMPNVILTPHIAGWSIQSYERISVVLLNKIKGFLKTDQVH